MGSETPGVFKNKGGGKAKALESFAENFVDGWTSVRIVIESRDTIHSLVLVVLTEFQIVFLFAFMIRSIFVWTMLLHLALHLAYVKRINRK